MASDGCPHGAAREKGGEAVPGRITLNGRERRGEAFVGVSRAVLGGGRGTSGVNPAARSSAREYVVGENR